MQNLTEIPFNSTSPKTSVIVKMCAVIPFFCFFLCCITVMLHTFASHKHFLDTSRYILFAHMLINDTLQILTSVTLSFCALHNVRFALLFCAPLLVVSNITFQNTSLILAAMSLERYVAIFYPLQPPAFWRSDRIWVITLCLWLFSLTFPITEFCLRKPDPALNILSTPVLCINTVTNSSSVQAVFRATVSVFFFTVVAVIILFTYLKILLETRKLRQDRASVSKALHTVLLHGFQLLLCMLAFTHPFTETLFILHTTWLQENIRFFNYFCFMLVPRFLSPLIYGFRDQSLRKHIGKTLICGPKRRVKPSLRC